jgi:alkylhydroperoxidase family enzyme
LGEDTVGDVLAGRVEGLAASHRAALALADALMTQPASLRDGVVTALRDHFTDAQLVELTLDIMKWNAQKVPVALGTDVWLRPGELSDLEFDDDGNWLR